MRMQVFYCTIATGPPMETIRLPIFIRNIEIQIPCGPVLEEVASYKKGVPAQENVKEHYTSGQYPWFIGCMSEPFQGLIAHIVHIRLKERI